MGESHCRDWKQSAYFTKNLKRLSVYCSYVSYVYDLNRREPLLLSAFPCASLISSQHPTRVLLENTQWQKCKAIQSTPASSSLYIYELFYRRPEMTSVICANASHFLQRHKLSAVTALSRECFTKTMVAIDLPQSFTTTINVYIFISARSISTLFHYLLSTWV